MKHSVPVFARHDSEQHLKSSRRRPEVGVSIDSFAVFQTSKQDDPDQGVAGDEEGHAHDDEERLVD